MLDELKTPNEWLQDTEFNHITIMDPDGWDRKNFEVSWCEKISRAEFSHRLMQSTIIIDKSKKSQVMDATVV